MNTNSQREITSSTDDCLAGGGEMGRLMRSLDWSATPLGPVAEWPQSLKTSVSICLNSAFPLLIWWGKDLVKLYNDAYCPLIGDKHPRALGQRGRECWPEIWDIIGPMLQGVLDIGQATRSEDLLLFLKRHGYPEECYFTFSYSPIRDETGGVGGVFTPVQETSEKVIGARRLRTLRDLAAQSILTTEAEEACRLSSEVLAQNLADIPFALIYLFNEARTEARLVGASGIEVGTEISPACIPFELLEENSPLTPLKQVSYTNTAECLDGLAANFGPLPTGVWNIPPESLIALPITLAGNGSPLGLLVAAVNPHKALDSDYRNFYDLVAGQIAAILGRKQTEREKEHLLEALRESELKLRSLFENAREAIGIATKRKIAFVNPAYARMLGYASPQEMIGLSTLESVAPKDRERLAQMAQRRHAGEAVPFAYEYRGRKKDGTECDLENFVSSYELDGQLYTVVTTRDITTRKQEEVARQFLSQAAAVLASSLDYEQTLQQVAALAVPHIADWCGVDMLGEDGSISQLVVAHVDPEKVKWGHELRKRYPPDPNAPKGLPNVLRTGQPEIYSHLTDELLAAGARDAQHLDLVRQIGLNSVMIVPMMARERVLGAITFVATNESGHHYTKDDLELAEGLATRAAIAIDNARLYRAAQEELAERKRVQQEVEALNVRLQRSMRETHHRVKNNLQVITALVNMQQMQYEDQVPTAELQRLTQHIKALASIHDLLTHQAQSDSEVSDISVQEVMERLMPAVQGMVEGRKITFTVQDIRLPVRQSTTFAILVNELVSNALKHGRGEIHVCFCVEGSTATLQVLDEGPGFPPGFNPIRAANTGLDLIDSLARMDMRGSVRYENRSEGGGCVLVEFPVPSLVKTPGEQ